MEEYTFIYYIFILHKDNLVEECTYTTISYWSRKKLIDGGVHMLKFHIDILVYPLV